MYKKAENIILLVGLLLAVLALPTKAEDFSDQSYIVAKVSSYDYKNARLWDFIKKNQWIGIEFDIVTDSLGNNPVLSNTQYALFSMLEKIEPIIAENESRILPVFINYNGDVHLLDSIINSSTVSSQIFYLPQGEKWPSTEYLVQANRRIIFFVNGEISNESRILHHLQDYALQIGASRITPNSALLHKESNINKELFKVNNFNRLPIGANTSQLNSNLVPDYINFLLDSWTKVGKKPNFISVGSSIYSFDFITDQLNSFDAIKGLVRTTGKNLERVYWKNADVLITGGKFSFPIRGGEEIILTPFAPGYSMSPEQLIITNEMQVPENYSIFASPLSLSEGITAIFHFEESVKDFVNPERTFEGRGFSFSQDIDRGSVLRLPENSNVTLGNPNLYGLPNSSFTVSCFVKFTDILEFGDNAVLGNDETGYRRGLHLVLRSGHPYFGLWANDYMSEEVLLNNAWYHLTWRYIIETGEQAIFVNGQFVGGSDGHPAYSGSSDLHIGSALSAGASLRGYIDNLNIWNRPLGNEEITRLFSDEEILLEQAEVKEDIFTANAEKIAIAAISLLFILLVLWISRRKIRIKKESFSPEKIQMPSKNQIQFFGEFKATNSDGTNISNLFTPKVKELLVYTVIHTLKNGIGAPIAEVNETLWHGIDAKKVANNRAVTLNKLRKILVQFNQVEILSNGGYLQLQSAESFFCDYIEAFKLCEIPEGMTRQQHEMFFHLVKRGRLLKGIEWLWLDDIRGFTGNQVIDNLLKLATIYKKENKLQEVDKVAQRILDYDDLNEEAIYLQVWALQKADNSNLAKFNFNSFCSKYEKSMGEAFAMNFQEFTKAYSQRF